MGSDSSGNGRCEIVVAVVGVVLIREGVMVAVVIVMVVVRGGTI